MPRKIQNMINFTSGECTTKKKIKRDELLVT